MLIETPLNFTCKSPTILLAHGAGAAMDSSFMAALSLALVGQGIQVVRFNFKYMQRRVDENIKMPPPKIDKLLDEYQQNIVSIKERITGPLFIGGKSMGSRVATRLMAAQQKPQGVLGIVAFGFPFHAPKKAPKDRIEHLPFLPVPLQVLQGTRDALGNQDDIASYNLPKNITINWLQTADHDFKPLKKSGKTQADMIDVAAEKTAFFMNKILQNRG